MASVLLAARAGQVESEASETIQRFVRRRAWLGPNPGLPPHLGDSLSLTAARAHTTPCKSKRPSKPHACRRDPLNRTLHPQTVITQSVV